MKRLILIAVAALVLTALSATASARDRRTSYYSGSRSRRANTSSTRHGAYHDFAINYYYRGGARQASRHRRTYRTRPRYYRYRTTTSYPSYYRTYYYSTSPYYSRYYYRPSYRYSYGYRTYYY